MKFVRLWLAALFLLMVVGVLLGGCGEKITIPEPKGLFSISAYIDAGSFPLDDPRQIVAAQGAIFVIHGDTLSKRNLGFQMLGDPVTGFGDPRAICTNDWNGVVLVWDQANSSVSWYDVEHLGWGGTNVLPDVQSVVSMATSNAGISQVPGAETFLYLADPDSGVVHRYAFSPFNGLSPHGILARSDGTSARFVHEAAGLARDSVDSMLVCDADTARNWVIRFVSSPDLSDTTTNPDDQDPLRGLAAQFRTLDCAPQPTAAYVLGNAPGCNGSDWVGGPSSLDGEFHSPRGVAVDGQGRIFVSDTENNRVQIFSDEGLGFEYAFRFVVNPEGVSRPTSLTLVDKVVNPTLIHFGAYLFVVLPDENRVNKFISFEELERLNPGTPPPNP